MNYKGRCKWVFYGQADNKGSLSVVMECFSRPFKLPKNINKIVEKTIAGLLPKVTDYLCCDNAESRCGFLSPPKTDVARSPVTFHSPILCSNSKSCSFSLQTFPKSFKTAPIHMYIVQLYYCTKLYLI